jgi:integrase
MPRARNQTLKKTLSKDRQLAGIKAPARGRAEYRITKVPGLVLRVTPAGKKSWALWLRDDERGQYRLKTLGSYPALSLKEACAKAQRFKSDARDGAQMFGSPPRLLTFAELADEYMKRHARPNKRSANEDDRKLRRDLVPGFGRKAADEVMKTDIVRMVNSIADRNAGVAANRTLALLRKIYNWGLAEGLVATNPVAGVPMRVKEEPRERVLTDGEIGDLWLALDGKGFDQTTADVLRFQLLIGARVREVTSMRVSELVLTGPQPTWRLPKDRAKSNRDIVRPLSPHARDLVLRRIEGRTPEAFVFASPQDPSMPIAPRSPAQAVSRAAEQGFVTSGWTPHDLRRTVATKLAALGVAETVTKRILGHAPPKKDVLASVYDRHSYLPEMRSALERWEVHLFDLIEARAVDEAQMKSRAA